MQTIGRFSGEFMVPVPNGSRMSVQIKHGTFPSLIVKRSELNNRPNHTASVIYRCGSPKTESVKIRFRNS